MPTPNPLQIAYFSPLPPARSGIADYSRELLPHLAQHARLTLFCDRPDEVEEELKSRFVVAEIGRFPAQRWQFDLALYQMGNSQHHETMYQLFWRYPGILVLHDYYLHMFVADRTVGQGNSAAYLRELAYELGLDGVELAQQILAGQKPHPFFDIPLNQRLIELSLGVITHSTQHQKTMANHNRPVAVIPALIEPYPGTHKRQELAVAPGTVIFAAFGQITTNKQITFALEAFQQVHELLPQTVFLLVGEVFPEVNLESAIQTLGLQTSVFPIGHVERLQTFVDWIHTADIVINLRYPTVGETSATALRGMAAARPLIVFDHGWYSEIPDGAAVKIPPMDKPSLIQAMLQLAQDHNQREQMGQIGYRYTQEQCHPAHVAKTYIQFCHQVLKQIGEKYE